MPDFHVAFRNLLHAVNLRNGTDGFTSPLKEGVLRIFFALKNPTASAGFEPANLGTKGQHATSRPPKPSHVSVQESSNFNITVNLLIPRKTTSFLAILTISLSTSNLLVTHRVCYMV